MNDQEVQYTQDRSVSRSLFLAKAQRYQRLFFGKWWVLFFLALVGLAGAWVFSRFQPPLFSSFGRMIVNVRLSLPEGSVYTEELSNFVGTQAALMQSGVVVNRAHARITAADPTLVMQPVKLKVTVIPRTTIFVLEGTGTNAPYAQAFVQAVMDEYIAVKREMRTTTSDTTLAGLTEEVMRIEREVRKADQELVEFQSTNSVVLLQEQGNNAGTYLANLNQRIALLKSEYELLKTLTLEQNLERRQNPTGTLPLTGDVPDRGSAMIDSDYLKAKQQILLLKAEQADMAQFMRPKHPKMVLMSEDIARRERLLEIYKQQSAEQLESRKNSLALQIENLEKDAKEWDTKTLDVSRKTAEFQRLKANAQRQQVLYDKLMQTLQTLDVNKEISPETVTVMEKASPALPDHPALSKQLLIGALAGIAAAIGLLLLLDKLDDRLASYSELRAIFDEEVLGQVPKERPLGPRTGVALIQADDDRHSFVEAYRNLRSSLMFLSEGTERPKTILLTSSIPNEGKSLTSANLAITMASTGLKVLLVDADLRKGSQHSRFGLPSEPGTTEALSKGLNWEEAARPTKYEHLSLLPRGAISHRSSEFFLSSATKKFLEEARAKYDVVVIDTAPVMAADDVTSLAPLVDGVVFVLRAEHTSARVARAALDSLYQRQAKVLGIVFNSVRPSSSDYYYYYKYKQYYSSSEPEEPEKVKES